MKLLVFIVLMALACRMLLRWTRGARRDDGGGHRR